MRKFGNEELKFLFSNGILSSRDEQVYWIFSESKLFHILGYFQLILILLKSLIRIISLATVQPTFKIKSKEKHGPGCLVIWPADLWGGFSASYLPIEILDGNYSVLIWKKKKNNFDLKSTLEHLKLTVLLLKYLLKINDFSHKMAYVTWVFTSQPIFLLNSLIELEKIVKERCISSSSPQSLFYPFEFYPEARLVYYCAQKLSMEALSAQHMSWTVGKISNFVSPNDDTAKPDKLYLSHYQDKDVFCGHVKETVPQEHVGRFDTLLNKTLEIHEHVGESLNVVLCSGSPYDINRSIEFVVRLRKSRDEKPSKLVLHPNLNSNLKFLVILICKIRRVHYQFGFDHKLSSQSVVFTCGTSLLESLKNTSFRVKNIGGYNSQF